jgi:hypothetical protein
MRQCKKGWRCLCVPTVGTPSPPSLHFAFADNTTHFLPFRGTLTWLNIGSVWYVLYFTTTVCATTHFPSVYTNTCHPPVHVRSSFTPSGYGSGLLSSRCTRRELVLGPRLRAGPNFPAACSGATACCGQWMRWWRWLHGHLCVVPGVRQRAPLHVFVRDAAPRLRPCCRGRLGGAIPASHPNHVYASGLQLLRAAVHRHDVARATDTMPTGLRADDRGAPSAHQRQFRVSRSLHRRLSAVHFAVFRTVRGGLSQHLWGQVRGGPRDHCAADVVPVNPPLYVTPFDFPLSLFPPPPSALSLFPFSLSALFSLYPPPSHFPQRAQTTQCNVPPPCHTSPPWFRGREGERGVF